MPRRTVKCFVSECLSTSDTHRLFGIPRSRDLRNLWVSFLLPHKPDILNFSDEALKHKKICTKHFEKMFIRKDGSRRQDAYPALITPKEIELGIPLLGPGYDHHDHTYAMAGNTSTSSDGNIELHHPGSSQDHTYCKTVEPILSPLTNWEHASGSATETQNFQATLPMQLNQYEAATEVSDPSTLLSLSKRRSEILTKKVKKIVIRKKNATYVDKIKTAKTMIDKKWFIQNFDHLNKATKTFFKMQLRQAETKQKGCRYTLDEKILALSLLKESPKCYRLLKKMFILPSVSTLRRLSKEFQLGAGINENLFDHLAYEVHKWDTNKKLCSIVFDEMQLSCHVSYNESNDQIDGFVDNGLERGSRYADHALVFMVRGVCSNWRQPLAYYFIEGTIDSPSLQRILKDITNAIVATGLIPMNLICDQGSTFRSAMKEMMFQTRRHQAGMGLPEDGTVEICGCKLNVIFDPPHLIKGIRNNFLNKDMVFEGKDASWRDIMTVHEVGSLCDDTKLLPKLTDCHIIPEKIKKMKVSYATQVLSSRMSALLEYTSLFKVLPDGKPVSGTMKNTSKVVAFFDKLFDSVNGSKSGSCRGKLRGATTKNSAHSIFWQCAQKTLREIKFKDISSKRAMKAQKAIIVRVPSLDGWNVTLESLQRLSTTLFNTYHMQYFYTRNLNQDPIENFFGRIRAINYRNTNPDTSTFQNSFKSLLISQIISHSKNANCEEDEGDTVFKVNNLFKTPTDKENIPPTTTSTAGKDSEPHERPKQRNEGVRSAIIERMNVHSSAYTAGYVSRKLMKKNPCKKCLITYTSKTIDDTHQWITCREYKGLKGRNLTYPSEKMILIYRNIVKYVHSYLDKSYSKPRIVSNMKTHIEQNYEISWLGCTNHNNFMKDYFISQILRLHTHAWCNRINKILKGTVGEKLTNRMSAPQKAAYQKYITSSRRNKKKTK